MALSMLGYRCCSDLNQLPEYEFERKTDGRPLIAFSMPMSAVARP
jgi:hypothetical protein